MSVTATSHIAVYVNPSGSKEPYGVLGLLLQKTDETHVIHSVFMKPDRLTESLAASLNDEYTRQSTEQSSGKKTVHFAPNANGGDTAESASSTAAFGESGQLNHALAGGIGAKASAESKLMQLQKEFFPESTFGDPSVSIFARESEARDSLDTLQNRTKRREVKPPVE